MKTKTPLILVETAAVFLATQTVRAEDWFALADAASKITKGPVVASPHGLEEFPRLTRDVALSDANRSSASVPESVKHNDALAASPRAKEDFPALARSAPAPSTGEAAVLVKVRENAALANSPRVREEFPSLPREASPLTNPVKSGPLEAGPVMTPGR